MKNDPVLDERALGLPSDFAANFSGNDSQSPARFKDWLWYGHKPSGWPGDTKLTFYYNPDDDCIYLCEMIKPGEMSAVRVYAEFSEEIFYELTRSMYFMQHPERVAARLRHQEEMKRIKAKQESRDLDKYIRKEIKKYGRLF